MDTSKGRDMPSENDGSDYDMPVRPAQPGYGATAEDIARGYLKPAEPPVDDMGIYSATLIVRRRGF